MPESSSNLELLLERWSRSTANAEPRLRPHLDELTDHLRSEVETQIAAGSELSSAFAGATDALGDPADLAHEFARSTHLPGRLFGWLADDRHRLRGDLTLVSAWIGMSLVWAGALVASPIGAFDLSVNWMLVGWFVTTFGPLNAIDFKLRRARAARAG